MCPPGAPANNCCHCSYCRVAGTASAAATNACINIKWERLCNVDLNSGGTKTDGADLVLVSSLN